MLIIATSSFTFAVIMGIWLAICALRNKRPLKIVKPLHVGFAIIGTIFMLVALANGDERLMLDVALAIAITAFGVIMSLARKRGIMLVPLFVCHILLAIMLYISILCFTIFPSF